MIGESHRKGDLGELQVALDCMARGYQVSFPFGHNHRYDLIVDRQGKLERVQVKSTESDGERMKVYARTDNGTHHHIYSPEDFEWLAVYDKTTDQIFYIPSTFLTGKSGVYNFRLTEAKNKQKKGVNWAKDFTQF